MNMREQQTPEDKVVTRLVDPAELQDNQPVVRGYTSAVEATVSDRTTTQSSYVRGPVTVAYLKLGVVLLGVTTLFLIWAMVDGSFFSRTPVSLTGTRVVFGMALVLVANVTSDVFRIIDHWSAPVEQKKLVEAKEQKADPALTDLRAQVSLLKQKEQLTEATIESLRQALELKDHTIDKLMHKDAKAISVESLPPGPHTVFIIDADAQRRAREEERRPSE